ncbi:hypothetical protein IWX49DRAFT_595342 [Phyllosticta citricarpa]|uniref:Secreted protein n=1 Tax=Phyllosticta paracitricarpa TaxID=2016321 RepID=A0ABR1MUJ3_9PEZI
MFAITFSASRSSAFATRATAVLVWFAPRNIAIPSAVQYSPMSQRPHPSSDWEEEQDWDVDRPPPPTKHQRP